MTTLTRIVPSRWMHPSTRTAASIFSAKGTSMQKSRRPAFGAIVAGALLSVLGIDSSTAHADVGPLPCRTGGSIISHAHIYLTYWTNKLPNGSPDPAGDPQGVFGPLQTYLAAVGGSDALDALTQYSNGSTVIYNDTGMLRGWWTDSTPAPTNPSDDQFKATAIRAAQHFNAEADPDAIQIIATDTRRTNIPCGAKHMSVTDGANIVALIDLPYVMNSCGPSNTDQYFFFAAHELTETITDPRFDTSGTGCATSGGDEIADRCPYWGDRISSSGLETSLIYSNIASTCVSDHPYYPLQFDDRDSERFASVDWASGSYKVECGYNDRLVGVSINGQSRPHSALCAKSLRVQASSQRTLGITNADNRADTTTGNWDSSNVFKGECASNETVVGISQDFSTHAVTALRCSLGQPYTSCHALVFTPGTDHRSLARNNDWAPTFAKNECGGGETVKGVSRDRTTGTIHALLCCSGAY
jgi:hypothetical protein